MYHSLCKNIEHQDIATKSYRFTGTVKKVLQTFHSIKSSFFGLAEDALFLATFQVQKENAQGYDKEFQERINLQINPFGM